MRASDSKPIAGYGNKSKFSAPELKMALHRLKHSEKRIHGGSDADRGSCETRIARLSTELNKRSAPLSEG
jgi:hypothetical protein